ncbi:MAG TPA: MBL fold metallo-hydrolase [Candidatus Margulisbacteria bacterium]|nr:MAG: hypothetical protein A2X43_09935 [Candidatus Margulisbacteria bacterium GWD2_39_127]HAR61908.1 MBL fold metallo-hydrolase [Candidatus Margulisiibacteriota bacterium]
MNNQLSIDTFIGGENAFFITSTIISGARDAVLIDAQFTKTDALKLAKKIKDSGKNLTTVYVTHGHPDHYWGFTVLSEQFPEAQFITAPEVLDVIEETFAAKIAQWKPVYGEEVPDVPIKPVAYDDDAIDLEGNQLRILHVGQGDVRSSTVVWIPVLSAIAGGDIAYNGTHVWLAETDNEQRLKWINNLEHLADMNPKTVIAGHKQPGSDDEGIHVLLTETRNYITTFNSAILQSSNARELIKIMTEKYPDRALHIILEIAANNVFPPESKEARAA